MFTCTCINCFSDQFLYRHYCLVIKVEKLTTPSNVKNKRASYHEYTVDELADSIKVVFILNKLPRR